MHRACFFLNAVRQVTYYGSANRKFASIRGHRNEKKKGGPFPFSPTLFDACHAANGKYIFENCPQIRANYTRRSRTPAFKSRLYGHLRVRTRLHDVFKVGMFIWIKMSQHF